MSHPAASVKSIYSGKVNLDREGMDPYVDEDDMDDIHDKISSPSSHISNLSVSSRNLRTLNDTMVQPPNNKLLYKHDSSTNISIASSSSDYQNNVSDLNDITNLSVDIPSDSSSPAGLDRNLQETVQFEGSRPMSRNSTTSCLSTTATKDGVEGKRFHRYGPSPYSAAIIQNMIQTHNPSDDYSPSYAAKPQVAGTPGYGGPFSPVADSNNMSSVSLQTTNAEFDGEPGERRFIQIEQYSNSVPPVSLKEKIKLLDNDR